MSTKKRPPGDQPPGDDRGGEHAPPRPNIFLPPYGRLPEGSSTASTTTAVSFALELPQPTSGHVLALARARGELDMLNVLQAHLPPDIYAAKVNELERTVADLEAAALDAQVDMYDARQRSSKKDPLGSFVAVDPLRDDSVDPRVEKAWIEREVARYDAEQAKKPYRPAAAFFALRALRLGTSDPAVDPRVERAWIEMKAREYDAFQKDRSSATLRRAFHGPSLQRTIAGIGLAEPVDPRVDQAWLDGEVAKYAAQQRALPRFSIDGVDPRVRARYLERELEDYSRRKAEEGWTDEDKQAVTTLWTREALLELKARATPEFREHIQHAAEEVLIGRRVRAIRRHRTRHPDDLRDQRELRQAQERLFLSSPFYEQLKRQAHNDVLRDLYAKMAKVAPEEPAGGLEAGATASEVPRHEATPRRPRRGHLRLVPDDDDTTRRPR
jgi:hypothetical protein